MSPLKTRPGLEVLDPLSPELSDEPLSEVVSLVFAPMSCFERSDSSS